MRADTVADADGLAGLFLLSVVSSFIGILGLYCSPVGVVVTYTMKAIRERNESLQFVSKSTEEHATDKVISLLMNYFSGWWSGLTSDVTYCEKALDNNVVVMIRGPEG